MRFQSRLTLLRKERKLSLREAAKRIGVSESTYREWEYGRQIRGAEAYLKIAKAFGISLDELFGNDVPPSTLEDEFERLEILLRSVKSKVFTSSRLAPIGARSAT